MTTFTVSGHVLRGHVDIGGSKSCIPALIGVALLNNRRLRLSNVPRSSDLEEALRVLEATLQGKFALRDGAILDISSVAAVEEPVHPKSKSRSTLPLAGLLASMFGRVTLPDPKGCDIGERPIDLHERVLKDLGISLERRQGLLRAVALDSSPKRDFIRLSGYSSGATVQALLTAAHRGAHGLVMSGLSTDLECRFLIDSLESARVIRKIEVPSDGISVMIEKNFEAGALNYVEVPRDAIELGNWILAGVLVGQPLSVTASESVELNGLLAWLTAHAIPFRVDTDRFLNSERVDRLPKFQNAELGRGALHSDYTSMIALMAAESGHAYSIVDRAFPARIEKALGLFNGAPPRSVSVPDIRLGFSLIIRSILYKQSVAIHDPDDLLARGYPNLPETLVKLGARVDILDRGTHD